MSINTKARHCGEALCPRGDGKRFVTVTGSERKKKVRRHSEETACDHAGSKANGSVAVPCSHSTKVPARPTRVRVRCAETKSGAIGSATLKMVRQLFGLASGNFTHGRSWFELPQTFLTPISASASLDGDGGRGKVIGENLSVRRADGTSGRSGRVDHYQTRDANVC